MIIAAINQTRHARAHWLTITEGRSCSTRNQVMQVHLYLLCASSSTFCIGDGVNGGGGESKPAFCFAADAAAASGGLRLCGRFGRWACS